MLYDVYRYYQNRSIKPRLILKGVSFELANKHVEDPETTSKYCTNEEAKKHTEKYGAWFDAIKP